jgi:hypothetical protein
MALGSQALLRRGTTIASDVGGLPSEGLCQARPICDFFRDILEREAARLAVVPARPCGWTDTGTPDRLSRLFERQPASACVA